MLRLTLALVFFFGWLLPAGVYPAYPQGQKDNTHFQPEGARAVARLVFEGMKRLQVKQ